MSNAAQQTGEPTMEEILASIRRIISEEESDPALKADAETDAPPEAVAEDTEVFELTNVVEPEAPPPRPRPALVEPADDLAFESEPEPTAAAPVGDDGLVAPAVIERAASAFEALHRNVAVAATPAGNSLEGLIREMMKPLLKQWLDDHLPALVENIVREEVERAANRRR